MLEIFRDKSTLLILLLPFFIFPMLNVGMKYLNENSDSDIRICVDCDSQEVNKIICQFIENNRDFNIELISTNEPKEFLQKGKIDSYICVTENSIDFIYDSTSFDSLFSTTKLGDCFQQFYNSFLSKSYDNILQLNLKDESGNLSNTTDSISSIVVPILLILFIFQGTSSFANDLFAGEKERKTLELLLISGVKKQAIFFGKSMSLIILSIFNLLISLTAYFISFCLTETELKQLSFMKKGNPIINIIFIVIILLLLTIVSVILSTTVSMTSKNMKNSQILNEFVLAIPVGITVLLVLGAINDKSAFLNFIPIFNLLNNFNYAFSGEIDIENTLISLIPNCALIAVLIISNVQYMKTEKFIG